MINLSVIILNYNTRDLILNCLASIKNNTSQDVKDKMEVIVVDNGSTDNTVETVKQNHSWAKVIANKGNFGYGRANNIALKQAKGKIILFLNSDTLVNEGVFENIIEFFNNNKEAGAATPRLQLPDGSLDLACHRGFPTPWNALTYFSNLERLFPNIKLFSGYHQTWKNFNEIHEVDAISGACFFVKKKILDKIGNFDERYFMYAEDIDLCMRIKRAGWKIFYNPQAVVIHLKRRSGIKKSDGENLSNAKIRNTTTDHFYDTMKIFYDKHYKNIYPNWLRDLVLGGIRVLSLIIKFKNRFL